MVMVRELPLLPSPPTLNQKAQLPPGKLAAAGLTYFCVFGLGWVVRGSSHVTQARENKTREEKTRQVMTDDRTKQDRTRQDKTRQDKPRQDKTRQDKTRQDKTRQDKRR
jgi:hypothetical protein